MIPGCRHFGGVLRFIRRLDLVRQSAFRFGGLTKATGNRSLARELEHRRQRPERILRAGRVRPFQKRNVDRLGEFRAFAYASKTALHFFASGAFAPGEPPDLTSGAVRQPVAKTRHVRLSAPPDNFMCCHASAHSCIRAREAEGR